MYEIWELPDTRITEADQRDEAFRQLDNECRKRHDQAVANGEGAFGITYRFEIRSTDTGRSIAWLTYSPDTSRPYKSVLLDHDVFSERQP